MLSLTYTYPKHTHSCAQTHTHKLSLTDPKHTHNHAISLSYAHLPNTTTHTHKHTCLFSHIYISPKHKIILFHTYTCTFPKHTDLWNAVTVCDDTNNIIKRQQGVTLYFCVDIFAFSTKSQQLHQVNVILQGTAVICPVSLRSHQFNQRLKRGSVIVKQQHLFPSTCKLYYQRKQGTFQKKKETKYKYLKKRRGEI